MTSAVPDRGRPASRHESAHTSSQSSNSTAQPAAEKRIRTTLGILRDKHTDQVPGSVLLLSGPSKRNAPLGSAPRRRSASSLPSHHSQERSSSLFSNRSEKKRTRDGKIILEPQPDDSSNDPLNWSALRRDAALLSLGLYCMLGGGMTTILAAAFSNVAETYSVSIPEVALTTGIYMLGLGIGGVIMSPTAIIFGKRPVYLATTLLFILTSVWCALSPSYPSLVVARVVQGITVSPVECLPSATIAEIYFLHERAYRLGIYTLLLLGGKNLVPLVSAAIVQSLGWRWVFWMVAIIAGFLGTLLFFFVPETFWDRAPRAPTEGHHMRRPSLAKLRKWSHFSLSQTQSHAQDGQAEGGADAAIDDEKHSKSPEHGEGHGEGHGEDQDEILAVQGLEQLKEVRSPKKAHFARDSQDDSSAFDQRTPVEALPEAHTIGPEAHEPPEPTPDLEANTQAQPNADPKQAYTAYYREAPPKSYVATLRPFNGRLSHENWLRIAARPFVLAAYPAIAWSAAVYALSVGWLIVISESATTIYRSPETYNFTALQTGLVYISPFIGGILGTAVAGKVSDAIVRALARRNGGLYEPEFRLVMALPVALATTAGLMGYGWSAASRDAWIVPTVFFGVVSFGCTLGSTTAITFAVDSYRQYAGEALVTLNFCKNVLHGFVFSLFFNDWLQDQGSRTVFLALGGIQLGVLCFSVPMYIYGKRARMWTVRRNFMEKF